eukprot:4866500-Alexandrium_andersonii.AAC.1
MPGASRQAFGGPRRPGSVRAAFSVSRAATTSTTSVLSCSSERYGPQPQRPAGPRRAGFSHCGGQPA